MRVISRKALTRFWETHADAEAPLRAWFKVAGRGTFRNFVELRQAFANVDYVKAGNRSLYVFNVGGNKYRLIAAIHFNTQMLFVRQILDHREYDRGEWKK